MTVTPDEMKDYFEFLDKVRNGGDINMLGAPKYLQAEFGLTKKESYDIWSKWAQSFKERLDAGEVIEDEEIHVLGMY